MTPAKTQLGSDLSHRNLIELMHKRRLTTATTTLNDDVDAADDETL